MMFTGVEMDIKKELNAMMDITLKPEFELAINEVIEKSYKADIEKLGPSMAGLVKSQWEKMKPYLFFAYCLGAKAQVVPESNALLGADMDAVQKLGSGDFVLAPKEPTPKMIDATWNHDDEIQEMSHNTRNEFIYKKMIEAREQSHE